MICVKRLIIFFTLALTLGGCTTLEICNKDYSLLSTGRQPYPENAYENGVEGSVIVQFDITEQGNAKNIGVLSSNPPEIFDEAAVFTIGDYLFSPRIVDCERQYTTGIQYRVDFKLEKERPPLR